MSDILSIGASAISAYQKSLAVTGNNIANANTDGYVHRDATLASQGAGANSPLVVNTQTGSGVNVDVISRASDQFLRDAMWAANSASAQSQALSTSLGQLEQRVLMPTSTVSTTMQKFFSNLQDVANSPSSTSARISALTGAQQIVDQFHSQISAVNQEISFSETNMSTVVTSANALIKQLAQVNAGIDASTGSKQQPVDLMDQRDKLINQLSQLVSVKVSEDKSGKVTVFLGNSNTGSKLIDGITPHYLGTQKSGDRLDFIFDPGGLNATTNQVTGGTLAGLQAYRSQCIYTRDSFNKLALAFANNINKQHEQGVDLYGKQGVAVYSTDTLSATPSPANLGNAKMTIDLSNVASVANDTYVASYDASQMQWTVTAQNSKKTVTGNGDLSLDGMTFHFEGNAKNGDNFTVNPLQDAAAGIRLLITDPSQWAMSLPLYADTNPSNAGTASIGINEIGQNVPPPPIPQIQNVFSQTQTPNGAVGVKADGVVAAIPSGSTNVTLSSLRTLSSVSFAKNSNGTAFDPTALSQSLAQSNNPIVNLSINNNGIMEQVSLDFRKDLDNYISSYAGPPYTTADAHIFDGLNKGTLDGLADAINADLKLQGRSDQLTASVTNGVLTINALSTTQVSKASFGTYSVDGSGNEVSPVNIATGTVESGFGGTNLQIFTREGRQLSGPVLSPDQAKALLTVANGFSADAVYMPPSDTSGYRGLSISETTSPLAVTFNQDGSTSVKVSAFPQTDGAQATDNTGTAIAGAVYDLQVPASLSDVRLIGSDILGKNSTDIASALQTKLNQQATTQSIKGQGIDWGALGSGLPTFTVNVDGVDQHVTMERDTTITGDVNLNTLASNGPFSVTMQIGNVSQPFTITRDVDKSGNPLPTFTASETPLTQAWAQLTQNWSRPLSFTVDSQNHLAINLPPEVSTQDGNVSFAASSDATSLGLDSLTTINSAHFTSDGLPALKYSLVKDSGGLDHLTLSLPQQLNTKLPVVSITSTQPSQLAALGLASTVTAGSVPSVTLDNNSATLSDRTLNLNYLGQPVSIVVNAPSGTDPVYGINWYTGSDGHLRLVSGDRSLSVTNSNLGFAGTETSNSLNYQLTGSVASSIDLSNPSQSATLNVNYKGSVQSVTVSGNAGTSSNPSDTLYSTNIPGINWSVDGSGHVTLESDDPSMSFVSNTADSLSAATSLGFKGSDLTLSRQDDQLNFTSRVVDAKTNLSVAPQIDTSKSVSRVADSITLSGPTPEDLIVAVQSSNVKTNTIIQGVSGDPAQAVQTIEVPTDLQVSDSLSFTIPGLDSVGPIYISGAQSVIDVSSLLQNKINDSGMASKPTVSYDNSDTAHPKLVITFADNGYKPLVSTKLVRGNLAPQPLKVVSTNDGIRPGTGTAEVQSLQSALPMNVGDTFSVTLKLTPNDTNFTTLNIGPLGAVPSADFVSQLNKAIANAASITDTTVPSNWPLKATLGSNGKVVLTWRDVGDVSPANVAQTNNVNSVKRSLIASYPSNLARTNPVAPDFNVKITQPGIVELVDKASGKSLATRSYIQGKPISYMGVTFTVNGDASVGDTFSIVSDPTRTGDNRNAVLIGDLQNSDAFGSNSGSFQDIYSNIATQLSSVTQAANDTSTSAQSAAASLKSAYDGETGVSLDTEASNLLKFQQAYQASAEIINTAKTLFDTIYKIM